MPRYFFHIRNGDQYTRDAVGSFLPDIAAARQMAIGRAKKLTAQKGRTFRNAEIEIGAQRGKLIETIPFSAAIESEIKPELNGNDRAGSDGPAVAVFFSVAKINAALPGGNSEGWAIVRHEKDQPDKYVSRIFLRGEDAERHAERLRIREGEKAPKGS
jgi:hypothetical protein